MNFFRRLIISNAETSSYQLQTLNPDFSGAVCSSLDEIVYLNQKNFNNFSFHISNEYLKTSPVVFYFPKNSFLVDVVDEKMGLLKTAGLIDFWISKHMDLKYIKGRATETKPSRLSFQKLRGIFIIWLIGCLFGFIVFITEFLLKFISNNKLSVA